MYETKGELLHQIETKRTLQEKLLTAKIVTVMVKWKVDIFAVRDEEIEEIEETDVDNDKEENAIEALCEDLLLVIRRSTKERRRPLYLTDYVT